MTAKNIDCLILYFLSFVIMRDLVCFIIPIVKQRQDLKNQSAMQKLQNIFIVSALAGVIIFEAISSSNCKL